MFYYVIQNRIYSAKYCAIYSAKNGGVFGGVKAITLKGLEKDEGVQGEKKRTFPQKVFSSSPAIPNFLFTPAVKLGDFLLPDGIVDGFEDDGDII